MDSSSEAQKVVVGQDDPRPRGWKGRLPSRRLSIIFGSVVMLIVAAVITFTLTRPKPEASASVATVEITETGFTPAIIKIKKGERILWVNKDSKLHQVAADPHPTGESLLSLKSDDPLLQDEGYSAVFEKAGTFTYHDYLDPINLQGTVIVE